MAECTQQRRWLVRKSVVNMMTGQKTEVGSEWVDGPCGVPLFGDRAKIGKCRSCETGWISPENYPVSQ